MGRLGDTQKHNENCKVNNEKLPVKKNGTIVNVRYLKFVVDNCSVLIDHFAMTLVPLLPISPSLHLPKSS